MAGAVVEHYLLNPVAASSASVKVQKTLAQSAKLLIENKIQEFEVGSQFRVLYDRIETPGGGLIIFQGMVDATAVRGLQHRLGGRGSDALSPLSRLTQTHHPR
jgi:phage terminase large subunit